jgi:hypothetical protein
VTLGTDDFEGNYKSRWVISSKTKSKYSPELIDK